MYVYAASMLHRDLNARLKLLGEFLTAKIGHELRFHLHLKTYHRCLLKDVLAAISVRHFLANVEMNQFFLNKGTILCFSVHVMYTYTWYLI